MNRTIFVVSLLIGLSAFAQERDSLALKYSESITEKDLEKRLKILTSDEFAGRETGTIGIQLAAEFIQKSFGDMGLSLPPNGRYFQNFPLIEQQQSEVSVKIDTAKYKWITDFFIPRGLYKNGIFNGEVTFITSSWLLDSLSDKNSKDLLGKVLLVNGKEFNDVSDDQKEEIKEILVKYEIKALLITDDDFEKKIESVKKMLGGSVIKLASLEAYVAVPKVYISSEMFQRITGTALPKLEKEFVKGKKSIPYNINKKIEININREVLIKSSQNVLGYVEGEELKDEFVIITAHYDHLGEHDGAIYYGADDDGSGTTALMELAEAFAKAKEDGYKFKRSIIFMTVAGEEKGLLGSRFYTENPIFPLDNTITDLNIDMIGRYDDKHKDKQNYIYLIGSDRLSTDLHNLSEKVNSTYINLDLDYTFNNPKDKNRYYYRSDHYNFAKNNIPVIFYFSGVHADYHKPTDTIDKIDFALLKKRTLLVYFTAWELANGEQRPALIK